MNALFHLKEFNLPNISNYQLSLIRELGVLQIWRATKSPVIFFILRNQHQNFNSIYFDFRLATFSCLRQHLELVNCQNRTTLKI